MQPRLLKMVFALAAILCLFPLCIEAKERSDIPDSEKWNLTDIYSNDDAWAAAKEMIAGRIPELESFKGKLSTSAKELLSFLELNTELRKELTKLFSYAGMNSDLDVRNPKAMEKRQSLAPLATEMGAKTAWFSPEVLTIPPETLIPIVFHPDGTPTTWQKIVAGVGRYTIEATYIPGTGYTDFTVTCEPDPVPPTWLCQWFFTLGEMQPGIDTSDPPDAFNDTFISLGSLIVIPSFL